MTATPMEICPLCAMCPRLAGRWRPQVRCSCGAQGPRRKSPEEAIGRWNSVVSFVRQLRTRGSIASPAGGIIEVESAETRSGLRRLTRRLAWQCGLEPGQGC